MAVGDRHHHAREGVDQGGFRCGLVGCARRLMAESA
jgi:hypothetical protein